MNDRKMKSSEPNGASSAVNERAPASLRDLGFPPELAARFELAFHALGATADGRVVGYLFRGPDGVGRRIRLDPAEPDGAPGRAA